MSKWRGRSYSSSLSFIQRSLSGVAACRKQRLGRNLAQDELVVAEQRRRDRGDHTRPIKWRQLLLLDRGLHLLDQAPAELPLRLDRRPKLSRLHRSELLDQRAMHRSCHKATPLGSWGTGTPPTCQRHPSPSNQAFHAFRTLQPSKTCERPLSLSNQRSRSFRTFRLSTQRLRC